jgi:serine/threonine-protein kinase PknK
LLSGRPPYQSDTGGIAGHLLRVISGEPPPLTRSDVPPGVLDAIHRAMAREPADRFPDAWAFAHALRDLQRAGGLPVTDLADQAVPGSAPVAATVPAVEPASQPPVEREPAGNERPPSGNGPPPSGNGPPPSGNGPPPSGNGPPVSGNGPPPSGNGPAVSGPSPDHATPTVRVRPPVRRRRRWLAPVGIAVLAVLATAIPLLLARHSATTGAAAPSRAAVPATPATAAAPTGAATTGPAPARGSAPPTDPSALAILAPRALTVVADGGTTVSLRWQLAPGTSAYPLIVQATPASGARRLSVPPPGATSYTVAGLDKDAGYCFQAGLLLRAGTESQPPVQTWSAPACIRGAVVRAS